MPKQFIDNGQTRLAIRTAGRPSNGHALISQSCAQVAAVCYRNTSRGLEFLLVRTRGGRWTFPKGGIEAGLTHAQAAALEAFEEAGVHGRMQAEAFVVYGGSHSTGKGRPFDALALTSAHLCEVLSLTAPKESKRNPTWCSAEKAKRRLLADRPRKDGMALAGVIDRAVLRITRLQYETHITADGLQRVQFEASEIPGISRQMEREFLVRSLRSGRRQPRITNRISMQGDASISTVVSKSDSDELRDRRPIEVLQLGDGSLATSQKVTSIDRVRKRNQEVRRSFGKARK